MDARGQLGTVLPGTERKCGVAAFETAFGEAGEASSVGARSLCAADDSVVASHFALGAETALEPPERRVERENDQAKLLQQVGPVIHAAKMLRLMQHDLLKFGRGEPIEEPIGNQDAWAEKADHAWAV
jgi:hypothetical protein